jgi:hypothetical protein
MGVICEADVDAWLQGRLDRLRSSFSGYEQSLYDFCMRASVPNMPSDRLPVRSPADTVDSWPRTVSDIRRCRIGAALKA